MKCEWCEEKRYKLMGNATEMGTLYCFNLDYKNDKPRVEILKQRPPNPIWKQKYTIYIKYCPFCGKKLLKEGEVE